MGLHLNRFCCCCTTRTGTLVIGTLGWVLTLIQLFGFADNDEEKNRKALQNLVSGSNMETDYASMESHDSVYSNLYFKIGYGIVTLFVCLLMIVGVYKKDKRFILPWLVLKGFELGVVILALIFIFYLACVSGHGLIFLIFFILLLLIGLSFYFWVCVYSHYIDLRENDTPPAVYYQQPNSNYCPPPMYSEKSGNMA